MYIINILYIYILYIYVCVIYVYIYIYMYFSFNGTFFSAEALTQNTTMSSVPNSSAVLAIQLGTNKSSNIQMLQTL